MMWLIDRLGFDPVDAAPLESGRLLEPDGSPFAATYSAGELSNLVATDRGAQQPPERSVSVAS
jgi:predicted dinucleotide-binding enzyme